MIRPHPMNHSWACGVGSLLNKVGDDTVLNVPTRIEIGDIVSLVGLFLLLRLGGLLVGVRVGPVVEQNKLPQLFNNLHNIVSIYEIFLTAHQRVLLLGCVRSFRSRTALKE